MPKADLVFVLKAGEQVPGLDCDPAAGRLSIEFVFGPDGPVIFNPISGEYYCQMGIGIAIGVGRTLEIRRIDWGDTRFPQGDGTSHESGTRIRQVVDTNTSTRSPPECRVPLRQCPAATSMSEPWHTVHPGSSRNLRRGGSHGGGALQEMPSRQSEMSVEGSIGSHPDEGRTRSSSRPRSSPRSSDSSRARP